MGTSGNAAVIFKRMIAVAIAVFGYMILMNQVFAAEAVIATKKQPVSKPASASLSNAKTEKKAEPAAVVEDPNVKKSRRIVEGKVGFVSKRSISVEYELKPGESYEMLLPLGSDLRVEGNLKAVSELKQGDHVKVGIEQTNREMPGSDPVLLKTEALVIVLVARAPDVAAVPAATGAAAVK